MNERWLRCTVQDGMFSDEFAVTYRPANRAAAEYSFFVPRSTVRPEEGRVKVRVFQQGPVAWAVFPNEMQSLVPIDESDLIAA